jgi:GNAT superfamily N-acetyltransferase
MVLVAEEDGTVRGFAGFSGNEDGLDAAIGEVKGLYVDPDHWSRGIGSALLTAAEAGLRDAGYERAILWTISANDRTRRFYEHQGWHFDGSTKPHRSGVELVRYAKTL